MVNVESMFGWYKEVAEEKDDRRSAWNEGHIHWGVSQTKEVELGVEAPPLNWHICWSFTKIDRC